MPYTVKNRNVIATQPFKPASGSGPSCITAHGSHCVGLRTISAQIGVYRWRASHRVWADTDTCGCNSVFSGSGSGPVPVLMVSAPRSEWPETHGYNVRVSPTANKSGMSEMARKKGETPRRILYTL